MIPRHVEVIYCDDIRQEIGNKLSFMGVYTGNLLVPEFPTILPKLCIYATVITSADEPFEHLSLQIQQNGTTIIETGNTLTENSTKIEPDSVSEASADDANSLLRFQGHNFVFTLSPFSLETSTTLRILAETEKGPLRGRALQILLAKETNSEN